MIDFIMSRSYTVGPRTRTQFESRNKASSRIGDRGNRSGILPSASSGDAGKKSDFLANANSSPSKTCTSRSPLKPKVVTLADLSSGDQKTKIKPGPKPCKPTVRTVSESSRKYTAAENGQTTGARSKGKNTKMWDDSADLNNSTTQRGSRNTVSSYHGSRSDNHTFNSPDSNQASFANAQSSVNVDRQETYQSQGSYTRVMPDPKKRDKLLNQRSSELEKLEAYKERRKLGHVSMKPTPVGGARVSEEEVRRKQQREQQEKKYDLIRKREQWAEEKRQREDQEFAEKKTKARQQAEKNRQKELARQRELQAQRQDWIAKGGLERFGEGTETLPEDEESEEFEIDESAVDGLRELFPFKDPTKIRQMLRATKGNVNTVIDWLSD
ncbi:uncharacterized protein KIAA1211 homolog [Acanthaster planci]|uniref:Uncharacterized protein KIAA1211 homolog n=1 Tax=Acanthaster planci TaxID=133434 RepID=A0A8B7Y6X8_ACAPL|nr:uncharacterized protein KIAA1211 homolog [Acanthaster planci]